MQQQSISVFRNHYLSTDTNLAAVVTSEAISVAGNQVNMSVLLRNVGGTIAANELTFKLQGSIDGNSWVDISSGSINRESFGYAQLGAPAGSFPYPFVRVMVELETAATRVLFDVTLGFSDQ